MTRQEAPCPCQACRVAGCDRPPVLWRQTPRHPQREIHGRELRRFYDEQDARAALAARLRRDLGRGDTSQ